MSNPALACKSIEVPPSAEASLGRKAAHGALWTILFSLLNKGLALGSQIALAWFLVPDQFGVVALAISISSVVFVFSGTNLKALLIQRTEESSNDVSQVFWLSLSLNVTIAVCLAAAAPMIATWFGDKRLAPLLWILSAAIPVMALPTVYVSRLYREFRFSAIARIQFGEGIIRNGLAVPLAAAGFGPSSLIIPMFVSAVFAYVCCRFLAGPIRIAKPQPRQWPALIIPSAWLMLIGLIGAVQSYGTTLVLGCAHDPTAVGLYFWGFSLASQAIFLVAANLQSIFFPVLSKLNEDRSAQAAIFIRVCEILCLAIVPLCVLQWVLARPAVEIVFHGRWIPAVPVVQWLSIGMITQPLGVLASALFMARAEFKRLSLLTGLCAVAGIGAAFLGGITGGASEVAAAAGLSMLVTNFWFAFAASSHVFGRTRFSGRIFLCLGLFFPLGAVGWMVDTTVSQLPISVRLLLTSSAVLGLHLGFVRLFWPQYLTALRLRAGLLQPSSP